MSLAFIEENLMGLIVALTEAFPDRSVRVAEVTDRLSVHRLKVEIGMPFPLPTYVVQVLPNTWTAAQIADGARRFEVEAKHGLAMAGVP